MQAENLSPFLFGRVRALEAKAGCKAKIEWQPADRLYTLTLDRWFVQVKRDDLDAAVTDAAAQFAHAMAVQP